MNNRRQRFIDEYMIDFNATRAAIAAGYATKTATDQASKLLSVPEVRDEVNRRKAEAREGLRISAERVLWEMAALGFSNIFDYVEVADGELRLKEMPVEMQCAVSGIKVTKNGVEIKLHDKLKALEFLAKYTGLADQKGGNTVDNNFFEAIRSAGKEVDLSAIPELQSSAECDSVLVDETEFQE